MLLPAVPTVLEEPVGPNDRDQVDINSIIRFIRKSWRLCLTWIVVGVSCGFAFLMLSPSYYTAVATLLLEDRSSRPAPEPGGGAAVVDPAYADSQIQVLQSGEVVGRVVDKNRLTEVEEFAGGGDGLSAIMSRFLRNGLNTIMSRFVPPVSPGSKGTDTVLRHATIVGVKRALSISRVGLSNAVDIAFTSRDPLRSAAIANAIAQGYIDSETDLKRKARVDAASSLRNSLAEIRDKAFAIEPSVEGSVLTTPEAVAQAQARNRELQNKAETYRALYNSFLQRSYMESVDQSSYSGARVITSAEAPNRQNWPRPMLALAIAAACGVVGGLGHALLRQATDHTLRTVEDVRRSIGPYRIASVPKIGRRAWETGKSHRTDLQRAYVMRSTGLYHAIGKLAVTLQGRRSRRSGLIIAVAAPAPGAGASSVAAQFSRIIAETGQKILLVDANWRKSSFALSEVDENSGQKLASAVTTIGPSCWVGSNRVERGSLDVLVLRPAAPISELNSSLSIVSSLQKLLADYDCVVVDFDSTEQTGDLEGSMAVIDEVIVVAEARRTSSESLDGLLRLIPGNKIAAVVLNKV